MSKALQKRDFFIYSLIAMPLSILGLPLYIYLPTFYATEIGVDIAIVGAVLFVARLSDVLTDPLIGYLSDLCVKYISTRKPIMIFGSFIMLISFYFLINPNSSFPILWLMIFSIFVYLGWSMINIPYLTFSSELSFIYFEKSKLNSFREISTILGLLLALVVPSFFPTQFINEKLTFLYTLFTLLFIPFFIISMLYLKVDSYKSEVNFSIKKLKEIYNLVPNLRDLQIGYFFNNLANAIPATLFLLYVEFIIENKNYSDEILILYFLAGVVALPFWLYLSKRISKKSVWILSIILASSSFVCVLFLGKNDVLLFAIISFISGLSLGSDIAFPTSIQSDIVQKNREFSGLLFGIWTMITKLALAFSVVITFGLLGIIGFEKNNPSSFSLFSLILLYGLLPILLKLLALFFINRFKEID